MMLGMARNNVTVIAVGDGAQQCYRHRHQHTAMSAVLSAACSANKSVRHHASVGPDCRKDTSSSASAQLVLAAQCGTEAGAMVVKVLNLTEVQLGKR
jgi:hypothetical protein